MKRVSIAVAFLMMLFLFCSACLIPDQPDKGVDREPGAPLRVHYLDVGQADSIFLELPGERTMLIDAGEAKNGEQIVSYIRQRGYDRIDYLVATHPHADHIGGMETVVRNLDIGLITMPKAAATTKTYENLLLAIQERGYKIKTAKAGLAMLEEEGLSIRAVAPARDTYEEWNNYSIVLRLVYGDTSFLFTGDAETLSEDEMTEEISADVLKVGHHGSRSSTGSAFLQKVRPRYAVISCGTDNSYGHPHAETLQILQKYHVEIYRTDLLGTIVVTSDGQTIQITSDGRPNPVQTPGEPILVYVTENGTKYHREDCPSLSSSKIELEWEEAKERYTPCQRCHPPE